MITSIGRSAAALLILLSIAGCASLPAGRSADPQDPFEGYNRVVFSFNDALDRALLKPVAQAYRFVTPDFVRTGVSNFFANIGDVPNAVNELLQGKPARAATDVGRLAVNSTLGLLGLFDVATKFGLERRREDFGQTLGRWGLASGPYLVLPVFGPSSVRDTFGLAMDFALDPLIYIKDDDWRFGLVGLRTIGSRASFLEIEKTLRSIELDPYLFQRDAYLSRRRAGVFDGSPPETSGGTATPPAALSPAPPESAASESP